MSQQFNFRVRKDIGAQDLLNSTLKYHDAQRLLKRAGYFPSTTMTFTAPVSNGAIASSGPSMVNRTPMFNASSGASNGGMLAAGNRTQTYVASPAVNRAAVFKMLHEAKVPKGRPVPATKPKKQRVLSPEQAAFMLPKEASDIKMKPVYWNFIVLLAMKHIHPERNLHGVFLWDGNKKTWADLTKNIEKHEGILDIHCFRAIASKIIDDYNLTGDLVMRMTIGEFLEEYGELLLGNVGGSSGIPKVGVYDLYNKTLEVIQTVVEQFISDSRNAEENCVPLDLIYDEIAAAAKATEASSNEEKPYMKVEVLEKAMKERFSQVQDSRFEVHIKQWGYQKKNRGLKGYKSRITGDDMSYNEVYYRLLENVDTADVGADDDGFYLRSAFKNCLATRQTHFKHMIWQSEKWAKQRLAMNIKHQQVRSRKIQQQEDEAKATADDASKKRKRNTYDDDEDCDDDENDDDDGEDDY